MGDDPAVLQEEHDVGEAGGFAAVVGDVEDRDPGAAAEILEHGADVVAGVVVEGAERFVEAEDGGVGGEGAAEGDALGFATGESVGEAGEERAEAEPVGEFGHAGVDAGAFPAADHEGELEVLADREVSEEGGFLGDEADATSGGRAVGDFAAVEAKASGEDGAEAADGFEEGGLAGAGAAHQDGIRAGGDGERHAVEPERSGLHGELFGVDHGEAR
jgi:hypothetical protein